MLPNLNASKHRLLFFCWFCDSRFKEDFIGKKSKEKSCWLLSNCDQKDGKQPENETKPADYRMRLLLINYFYKK